MLMSYCLTLIFAVFRLGSGSELKMKGVCGTQNGRSLRGSAHVKMYLQNMLFTVDSQGAENGYNLGRKYCISADFPLQIQKMEREKGLWEQKSMLPTAKFVLAVVS